MNPSELYLKDGDVKTTEKFLKKLQANKQRPKDGLASLCGIVAANIGDYWDGQDLLHAFFGQLIRKHEVVKQVIALTNIFIKRGYLNAHHLNYNDIDDNLWADAVDGVDKVMLPDFENGNFTKEKECTFHWTKYTIFHESHGHAFIFFLKQQYFDHDGKRHITSDELHFRKIDENADKFRKQKPAKLWEYFVGMGDNRDKGFVLSCELRETGSAELRTSCEANLWSQNLFQELEHFDAIVEEPPE